MTIIYPERGSNIPLASLCPKVYRYFNSRLKGQLDERQLPIVQKMYDDYIIKARRGRNILAEWETKGMSLGRQTMDALKAQEEFCYRLGSWDEFAMSRIEMILEKTLGKRNDSNRLEQAEMEFAKDFFLNLGQRALSNRIYQSCTSIY